MVNTARTIYHATDDWQRCWHKLKAMNIRVQSCEEKMQRIRRTWALRGDWIDEEYKYLLGDDGLRKLRDLEQLVDACEQAAFNSLQHYCTDTDNKKRGSALKAFGNR
jgi:hypothetical protein